MNHHLKIQWLQLWLGVLLFTNLGGGIAAEFYQGGFAAEYEVRRNGIYLGITQRTLKPDEGKRWIYTSHTKPEGMVSLFVADEVRERSLIEKTDHQIRPLEYEYHQTGGKKEKHHRIRFDWNDHVIQVNGTNKTLPLADNTQDLMTFQLQLMLDLQQDKQDISYTIADRKRIREYELNKAEPARIDTPLGKLSTLRLVSKKTNTENQYKLWCAEALHYLPVKVQKVENDGDVIELVIRSFKPLR